MSVRSLATIRMSPTPTTKVTEIGSGVSKVGIHVPPVGRGRSRRHESSCDPSPATSTSAPSPLALGALRGASFASTGCVGSVECGGRCPDEPGIDRQPFEAGSLLDPGLQVIGQSKVDP